MVMTNHIGGEQASPSPDQLAVVDRVGYEAAYAESTPLPPIGEEPARLPLRRLTAEEQAVRFAGLLINEDD